MASYVHIAHVEFTNNVDTHTATPTRGPISDPERRHAPTTLATWTDGCDILDIYAILSWIEANGDAETEFPRARVPGHDHIEGTDSEPPVLNGEVAVHFFDYDTIYKAAKKIINSALSRATTPLDAQAVLPSYPAVPIRRRIADRR